MMGRSSLAVRMAHVIERARRAPGYARRRWRRLKGRLSGGDVGTAPGSTAVLEPAEHRPPHVRVRDSERRAWREVCAPLVAESSPDRTRARELLRRSGAMDAAWYLDVHADRIGRSHRGAADLEAFAVDHYLDVGWREGLAPSPWVDIDEVAVRVGTHDHEPVSLLEALRERLDLRELQHRLDRDRPADMPRDDVELRWRDLVEGQLPHEPTFVLYRILGNDLPPRHQVGQSERNLRFLLEHEPELPGCERRYVVNRIIDPEVERRLLEILDAHDASVLHLPFERDEYRDIGWRVSDFARPGMLYGATHDGLPEVNRARAIDHAFHDKNLYVMHNNGARNAALGDGRGRARWVLPFDGNCFFTSSAWDELRSTVLRAPHHRYVVVPMARVNDNDQLRSSEPPEPATDEPQIAFRNDAAETFHPDARYGRRPKVELLLRLGVSGPWNEWPDETWEPRLGQPCPEAGEYLTAGWVARLASGRPTLEADASGRMVSRMIAIRTVLTEVDEQVLRERFHVEVPVFRDVDRLRQQQIEGTVAGRDLDREVAAERDRWSQPDVLERPGSDGVVADTFAGLLLDERTPLLQAGADLARLVERQSGPDAPFAPLQPWELASLLDAARLLTDQGVLAPSTVTGLRALVEGRLTTLSDERTGGHRRRALDATGVWYEVEHLACAAYLDDAVLLLQGLRRIAGRIHDQFVVLPTKGARWRRRVSSVPNLLGWSALLPAIDRWGITICDPASPALGRQQRLAQRVSERRTDVPQALLAARDVNGPRGPDGGTTSNATTPLTPARDVPEIAPFWWAGVLPA